MLSLIKFFGARFPLPGEEWEFRGQGPFGTVKILEVKKGFVRYYMGKIFYDERMSLVDFISIYRFSKGLSALVPPIVKDHREAGTKP